MGGAVWYSETFMDPSTLVRFDIETEGFESWEVPECFGGGYYPVSDADKNIWLPAHDTDKMVGVRSTHSERQLRRSHRSFLKIAASNLRIARHAHEWEIGSVDQVQRPDHGLHQDIRGPQPCTCKSARS